MAGWAVGWKSNASEASVGTSSNGHRSAVARVAVKGVGGDLVDVVVVCGGAVVVVGVVHLLVDFSGLQVSSS